MGNRHLRALNAQLRIAVQSAMPNPTPLISQAFRRYSNNAPPAGDITYKLRELTARQDV